MSEKLKQAIVKLQKSGRPLLGGNCGMVALALYKFISSSRLEIAIATNVDTEEQLFNEPTIYHVFLLDRDKAYDGEGQVSIDSIADWIEAEYGDSDPAMFMFGKQELDKVQKIIRNETDWTINWTEFYKLLK